MKGVIKIIISLFLLSYAIEGNAQDDKNWFQRLFNKEDKQAEPVDTGGRDSLDFLLDEFLKDDIESGKNNSDTNATELILKEGRVDIIQSSRLRAINDSLSKHPEPLNGYRIQVFFGQIEKAKEARAEFIRKNPKEKCVLEHVPPNFSVRIGDFTDELHAYRRMKELKGDYPSAIIVPSEIDVPLVEK